jgi:hypothetical protein
MNYSYTDLEETGGLPLSQAWERAAIKDLSDIFHYLTHGLFFDPTDYADRLRQAADAIEVPIVELSPAPLPSPPLPFPVAISGGELAIGLGVYLNAVEIAAQQLGIDMNVLIRYGQARIQNQTESDINALCERVLAACARPEDREVMQIINQFPPEESA